MYGLFLNLLYSAFSILRPVHLWVAKFNMAIVPWKLASRPQKLCLCAKNMRNHTLQHICAAVARMDMRIWKYLLKARVVFADVLTPCTNMNAPIRDAFDCSSRKPMRRHVVSGFPRSSSLPPSREELWGRDWIVFTNEWNCAWRDWLVQI